jgi:hypothetical protein
LADFDNITGATTDTLQIVGAAEADAGVYTVVVTDEAGQVSSSPAVLSLRPVTNFEDNFDLGTTNWQALLDSTPMGAGKMAGKGPRTAAVVTNQAQKIYHNLGAEYSCRTVFTFWMYDDGSSLAACGQLRGYTGAGYGNYASPGGLWQEFIIGKYNGPFGTNLTSGTLKSESLNVSRYQGRVLRGTNAGWFNLDVRGASARSVGWHKFTIDRETAPRSCTVSFFVDDVLGKRVEGADPEPIDSLVIGSIDAGDSSQSPAKAWFSQVSLKTYPTYFDWQALDSTGRGLFPDWMKAREVGTNDAISSGASPVLVAQIKLGESRNRGGNWIPATNGIRCDDLRGYVDYAFTVPNADAYRLEITGQQSDSRYTPAEAPLIVSLDEENLGRFNLQSGAGADGVVRCFTPYIQAGEHKLRVYWDNAGWGRSLLLKTIQVEAITGPSNQDGKKTWVANRLQSQNGIDFAPASSLVSPVCVEGRGQYLSGTSLAAGTQYPLRTIPVRPGAGNRWYSDVPLAPGEQTIVETSCQNGGLKETNRIAWQVTDVTVSTNLGIRKGDSLLLGVLPGSGLAGEVRISVAALDNAAVDLSVDKVSAEASAPVPYQFNRAGVYRVIGTFVPTGETGSILVSVVEASLDPPIARVNRKRYWTCMNLPPGAVLDADPRLSLIPVPDEERDAQIPKLPPRQPNEYEYRVITRSTEPRYILARLGTNGPILASAPVQGFRSWVAPDTYLRLMETNKDGSQTIETAFVVDPLPPGLRVEVKLIVSGVTFDDGTVSKTLTTDNFDSLGVCRLRFIRGADVKTSVCHTFNLYDRDTLISWQ